MSYDRVPIPSRSAEFGEFCESPIEQDFFDVFRHYCSAGVTIHAQRWIKLPHSRFRPDFVLSTERGSVCIECDGKEYHDPARDELRDVLILGSGLVQGILRFPGWTLVHAPEDCVYTVSRYYPELFSEPGREAIRGLANPHVRELLDPPARVIHCDIRDSSIADVVPDYLEELEWFEQARFRPFQALFRSFDRRGEQDSDFRRAYQAILLRQFENFAAIQAKYHAPGMAEADYERLFRSGSARRRAGLLKSLRLLDAEYKIQCHFIERSPQQVVPRKGHRSSPAA
ncbi:MAG TPA: hypothetical protein VMV83_16285 [Rectinemataceae bacterium]|nr:hypothetical protein [Rectinemataceae bacterium]